MSGWGLFRASTSTRARSSAATNVGTEVCENGATIVDDAGGGGGGAAAAAVASVDASLAHQQTRAAGEIDTDVDDTYDILTSIETTAYENRKLLQTLVRRNRALEARLDEYDKIFSRLTEYLDVQLANDARQHNRLLRMGMPVPFRSSHTDSLGVDRVPAHGADRWRSIAKGARARYFDTSSSSSSSSQPTCNVGVHRDI